MNFSRQRESIINILKLNYEHPTAYRIYELVKEIEPTISKSTVYRNLEQLVELGKVRKISTGGNFEHYDIVRDSHSHAICKCCGNIFDVNLDVEKIANFIKNQTEMSGCNEIIVMGICKDCEKEN
ncbi:MAG: transcriptional repressor [Clostridia bacterium]|nr:transcriptional repressor [Clostridia bacterium]